MDARLIVLALAFAALPARAFEPREKYFARYAGALAYPGGPVPIDFLDYDWSLNDFRSSSPR